MEKINVKIKRSNNSIVIPKYATYGSGAVDLHADVSPSILVYKNSSTLVPTGISIDIERQGVVALLIARSGLALKHGIILKNGVGLIDNDYKDEIKVILQNIGEANFIVTKGMRIAQLIFMNYTKVSFQVTDQLSITGRGGFGSTGVD